MINLLVHTDSFRWNDITINRKEQLDDLVLLQQQIQIDKKCKTYKTPAFDNLSFDWGDFYSILDSDFDFKNKNALWLKPCVQPMNNSIFLFLFGYQYSPQNAETLADLDIEFQNDANAYIGLDEKTQRLVYDANSYNAFKISLIPTPEPVNWSKIRREIEFGNILPSIFKRLDSDIKTDNLGNPIHGQQVHIHFKDNHPALKGGALNLDGSWKHEPKQKEIPNEAKEYLLKWGFKVPQ